MSKRFNYIDAVLLILRVGIIGIVIWGIVGKLILGVGTTYTFGNWADFFVSVF